MTNAIRIGCQRSSNRLWESTQTVRSQCQRFGAIPRSLGCSSSTFQPTHVLTHHLLSVKLLDSITARKEVTHPQSTSEGCGIYTHHGFLYTIPHFFESGSYTNTLYRETITLYIESISDTLEKDCIVFLHLSNKQLSGSMKLLLLTWTIDRALHERSIVSYGTTPPPLFTPSLL